MFKNQYDPSMSHAVCLLIKVRLYIYIYTGIYLNDLYLELFIYLINMGMFLLLWNDKS